MTIKVTLIRPEGCAHCATVKVTLEKLKKEYRDIVVENIDMLSAKGQTLVKNHHIMASPGILVNDEFFAMGGATEAQFKKKFEQLKKKVSNNSSK